MINKLIVILAATMCVAVLFVTSAPFIIERDTMIKFSCDWLMLPKACKERSTKHSSLKSRRE